ncbi:MAG: pseudouridine synthase [Desulfatiglandales bacterium]
MASRRGADELILAGRVTVNDRPVLTPGITVQWGKDRICVDGNPIPSPKQPLYLMMNKPFGVISGLSDPEGRPVVIDLLRDVNERVYPVGRLDFNSLGLLLLTNDGEWAHRMTHPRYRVPRVYKVTLDGEIPQESMERLRRGVTLDDGFSGPAGVTLLSKNSQRSVIRIKLHLGRSRIIRRMLDAVGHPVIQLMRIGFGPLVLGDLKVGSYRPLTDSETAEVRRAVGLK